MRVAEAQTPARAVEGRVALDAEGRVVPGGSRFTVDLRQLQSDEVRRDVTRRVTWEATGTAEGQDLRVAAKTAFRFEDFGLRVPRVSVVLSVDETIGLETDLLLRRGA